MEPLGSRTSGSKELPFFVRTEGFFLSTAWFLDKLRASCSQKWRALGRSLPAKCATGYSLVTVVLPITSKLPFFVGAGGFEPPASWSRKKPPPLNPAKIGHYSQKLVHQVHRVTQFHYSLVTVSVAQHPCIHGWQSIRNQDDTVACYILHDVRFAGRSPPGVFRSRLTTT